MKSSVKQKNNKSRLKVDLSSYREGYFLGKKNGEYLITPFGFNPKKKKNKGVPLNQNALVIGGTRAGKTYSVLIPNILLFGKKSNDNMIITDTKGEIYNTTVKSLKENGYEVYVLNFQRDGFEKSMRFNPVAYVKNLLDAQSLVNTIIENTSNPNGNSDEMWKNAEASYLTALIMYAIQYFPEDQCNLGTIYRFGLECARNQEILNHIFENLGENDPARLMFMSFSVAEDKTRSGILIGFTSRLRLFATDEIHQITSRNDFSFDEFYAKKSILFLMVESDTTFSMIPALFFSLFFDFSMRLADSRKDLKLPRNIRFFLDEFANMGKISKFNSYVSVIASRGMSVFVVLQLMPQLADRYGEVPAKEIIAGFNTLIFLATDDEDTAKYISSILGKSTQKVVFQSHIKSVLMNSLNDASISYDARELMMPEEVKRFDRSKVLILQSERYPALIDKVGYPELFDTRIVDWHDELTNRQDRVEIMSFRAFFEKCANELEELKNDGAKQAYPPQKSNNIPQIEPSDDTNNNSDDDVDGDESGLFEGM